MAEEEKELENVSEEKEIHITLNRKNLPQILGVLGAVLLMIGCIVPIYSISFLGMNQSIIYISGDGALVLALAIGILVLTIMHKQIISALPVLGISAMLVYLGTNIAKVGFGTVRVGFFLLGAGVIFAIMAIVLAFMWKTDCVGKKSNTIAGIVLGVSILLGIVFLLVGDVLEKASNYKKAVEDKQNEKYEDAIEKFKEISNYKDSEEQILECSYLQAEQHLKRKEFDMAYEIYESLGEYKDSKDRLKESRYQQAIYLMNEEMYDDALTILNEIPDYGDSQERILECKYSKAQDYISYGNYGDAVALLEDIKSYKDCDTLLKSCYYNQLKEAYQYGDLTDVELAEKLYKKCNTKESNKYMKDIIEQSLSEFDYLEDYTGAIEYLKQFKKYCNVSKDIEKYKEIIKREEENRPPDVPNIGEFYDSTDYSAFGDGTSITVKWNAVKNASGYQYEVTESDYYNDPYYYDGETTSCSFTTGASDSIAVEFRVRAYKVVNGSRIYGDWSNTVYGYLNW